MGQCWDWDFHWNPVLVYNKLLVTLSYPGGTPRRVVELSTYHPGGRCCTCTRTCTCTATCTRTSTCTATCTPTCRSGVDDWLAENADITRREEEEEARDRQGEGFWDFLNSQEVGPDWTPQPASV